MALNNLCTLTGAFFTYVFSGEYMSELYVAYAEYLEKMFSQSEDLVSVDAESIPDEVTPSLTWLEWADFT